MCICIMRVVGTLQVAGQQSGLAVVDKAQSAVNTVKIINALNEISDILKACHTSHCHATYAHTALHDASLAHVDGHKLHIYS